MRGAAAGRKWKNGNMENVKACFHMRGAEMEQQAEAAWIFFHSGDQFMLPLPDFRSRKGAWLGSHQNKAKMPGVLAKADYERWIHLVSTNNPPWRSLYQIMKCVLLASFLYDNVHPEGVLSFTSSSKKDEHYCQQLLMHRQSLSKSGIIWCHVLQNKVTYQKGDKHEFHAAHTHSLLCFYCQKYRTIFATTKCRHAAPRVWIRSFSRYT